MKKIITLVCMLLIGVSCVLAQYDCNVYWTYPPGADCTPKNLPAQGTYHIEVTLWIYDIANAEWVTPSGNPPINNESTSATSTNFSAAQCGVSDYCDESHDNTPVFYLYGKVAFVDSSSQEFCSDNGQNTNGLSCNDFYNSLAAVQVTMN
ncbi:MAG TPA: hypothetical protein PLW31_14195 [Bacteroidales bacterium]|nr:hypothetical protein [Bacteroidales bacterium]HPI86199.1 hypothetical protein [Bacteroidales bacterium]HPM92380.1 hypothetical protein [Bacteroidales bacterium]